MKIDSFRGDFFVATDLCLMNRVLPSFTGFLLVLGFRLGVLLGLGVAIDLCLMNRVLPSFTGFLLVLGFLLFYLGWVFVAIDFCLMNRVLPSFRVFLLSYYGMKQPSDAVLDGAWPSPSAKDDGDGAGSDGSDGGVAATAAAATTTTTPPAKRLPNSTSSPSASEDSSSVSLTDSDRTLLGHPPEAEVLLFFLSVHFSSL